MLVGPGVENRVQLAAIDCHSVACMLEEQKREVTREGPTEGQYEVQSFQSFSRMVLRSPEFRRTPELQSSERSQEVWVPLGLSQTGKA